VNKEEFNQFVFLLEKKQDIYVLFITRWADRYQDDQ
jgi:hypothetical protein